FLVYMSLIQGVVTACRKKSPDQHISSIEFFGQALEDETRPGPPVIALPESGRPAPVDPVVAVMKQHDPEPARAENIAAQYPRTAPDQKIKVECIYIFYVLVVIPINVA